jgi:hypothetical protein
MRFSRIASGRLAGNGRPMARGPVACLATAALLGGAAPAAMAGTVTPGPAAAGAPACAVAYQVNSDWGSGFTVAITITNNGPAISSWVLQYSYTGSQRLQNGWNGTWSQSGQTVTVTSASWNGSLSAGASAWAGANFADSGANAAPTAFTLNGVPCNGGDGGQPTVTITSPADGTSVPSGSTVTVAASADANGAGEVSSVTFYADNYCTGDDAELGTAASAPYTVQWPGVPVGNFIVFAVVTTTTNVSVMSPVVNLTTTVQGLPPPCPVPPGEAAVSIVAPRAGTVADSNTAVPVSAVATVGAGFSITSVSFSAVDTCGQATTVNLGTVTTPPYTVQWVKPTPGVYTITASALVNGVTVKSAPVRIAAGPGGIPPPCPSPAPTPSG